MLTEEEKPASFFTPKRRLLIFRVVVFLAVIALSVFIFSIRDQAEELGRYGYPGIFLLSFLAYATVLLPAPGVFVVFTMGGVFHPLGVALAAGAGAALGEISGYLAGYSGQLVAERTSRYEWLTNWMAKNGPLTIFLLSAIPNPLFDLAGVAAGLLKMSVPRFFFWCLLGEILKMTFFAYAGSSSMKFLFGP
jgi:membrane protein YqaA with SNARE-associated domain